ncbi:MAG: HAD family hydrolase, partial [Acidithiobacillus sp.]|nr:HAD family hydrolase [Acidithiobacillus sp.]
AYPRYHRPDDVPDLYRWAAGLGGVFINPALTEPFGLTLIEAAACGLPILATEDGGPKDIIANCQNGVLIDPLNVEEIGEKLLSMLSDKTIWKSYAKNGIAGVRRYYSWQTHVDQYLTALDELPLTVPQRQDIIPTDERITADRLLFLGARLLDPAPIPGQQAELVALLHRHRRKMAFGLVSFRPLHELLALLKQRRMNVPDILITRGGTQIHYGSSLSRDQGWSRHIGVDWQGDRVYDLLAETPGVQIVGRSGQGFYAVHGFIHDHAEFAGLAVLNDQLHNCDIPSRLITLNSQEFLVVPQRASLGFAIRYVADRHDIALDHVLVVGSARADLDLLGGNILAAQVGGEKDLQQHEDIYQSQASGLPGAMEAITHYDFLSNNAAI